jgi:oxygen-dependent protoporphyrinogen oxidase
MKRVVVIGGGISGLSAAYRLAQAAAAFEREVMVFEAADRLGGVIRTEQWDGVVLEGGPDSFLLRKPHALELCQALGLDDQLIGTRPDIKGSYIFHRGRFYDIPAGMQAGIPTDFAPIVHSRLLSWGQKLRLLGDLVLPRQAFDDDIGLGRLLRYRFGNGLVDRLIAPLLAGIYAGDIDQLSTAMTVPQLLQYQKRSHSLIREAWRSRQSAAAPVPEAIKRFSGPFATVVTGLNTLIDRLAAAIEQQGGVIRVGSPVDAVSADSDGRFQVYLQDGTRVRADELVMAVPAYQAARILRFLPDDLRERFQSIAYADLAVIAAVYRPAAFSRSLDKTGFLVPKIEGLGMTAVTWVQSKWQYPKASPWVPIRAFYGRAGEVGLLEQSDEQLVARFQREIAYIMGVTDSPEHLRVFRIPQAIPQYTVGHGQRIQAMREALKAWPRLKVIGSYWDGVGIPDCVRRGQDAADAVVKRWREEAPHSA